MIEETKLTVGRIRKKGKLIHKDGRIFFKFGFWKGLNVQIKKMEGRKWHGYEEPPIKMWSIPVTTRNLFQLRRMKGENPYKRYDGENPTVQVSRSLYTHQKEFVNHMLGRHYGIIAGEMGTGKTLAAIELAEIVLEDQITQWRTDYPNDSRNQPLPAQDLFWYIGPKSAIVAVKYEFSKWDAAVKPLFMTYEALVKKINTWVPETKAPQIVVFDESSKIKTPTAQRSKAALALADGIRQDWGDDGYVIEMSGSPAPKSPADWWHQCEVACPGFLLEGNIHLFRERLAVIHERENLTTGGVYPHLVGWRDGQICDTCGADKDDLMHTDIMEIGYHPFIRSADEVSALYGRMSGLVLVKFKKDCLDLPEKRYVTVELEPTPSMKRAAKLIAETSPTAIKALVLLRELSDGFQYIMKGTGEFETCKLCGGSMTIKEYIDSENHIITNPGESDGLHFRDIKCPTCTDGKVERMVRDTKRVPCPKDDEVRRILEDHDDVGRVVVYAGFTGSIDRVVQLCLGALWTVIRVDGRGWHILTPDGTVIESEPIRLFQDMQATHPRVAFVGHPGSAGMGLTLTASPTILYYSNDHSGEARIQSEDRIHRPGMDENRGATIIDLIHLPTDRHVLENLKIKRKLQAMTLGELQGAFE